MSISRLGKPCAILVAFVAANAAAVVIQNKDVLGRTLQYDELDRESLSNIFWQLFLYHTVCILELVGKTKQERTHGCTTTTILSIR